MNPQEATLRGALKYFKITSYITGIFLVLIMILWGIRLSVHADLWLAGPDGFLALAYYSEGPDGIKTGYTANAGPCLVALGRQHGTDVLLVMLKARNRWWDAVGLFEQGFRTTQHEEAGDDGTR